MTVTSKKSGKPYHLHKKTQTNGTPFYYFAGEIKDPAQILDAIPEGMEVVENERTGLPMLRRKR